MDSVVFASWHLQPQEFAAICIQLAHIVLALLAAVHFASMAPKPVGKPPPPPPPKAPSAVGKPLPPKARSAVGELLPAGQGAPAVSACTGVPVQTAPTPLRGPTPETHVVFQFGYGATDVGAFLSLLPTLGSFNASKMGLMNRERIDDQEVQGIAYEVGTIRSNDCWPC